MAELENERFECPSCNGDKKFLCPECEGEDKQCEYCDENGTVDEDTYNELTEDDEEYDNTVYECPACKGSGFMTCPECGGSGFGDELGQCDMCNGSGELECEYCEDGTVDREGYEIALSRAYIDDEDDE